MKRAQQDAQDALRAGTIDARTRDEYLRAVEKYFGDFEKEARTHLRDVDRRLEHINQVHFNLNAERGVAVKRIEATQSIVADARALGVPAR